MFDPMRYVKMIFEILAKLTSLHWQGGQFADVTYVTTAGLWACCIYHSDSQGSLVVDCNNHSQEIFPAPAPSDLVTLQYIPTTGTPTYGAAIATTTSIASSSSGSSESSGSNIGGGAAAGIGVGVAAAIILIAMAIAFLFFRRGVYARSRAPRPESGSSTAPVMPHTGSYSAWVESATNLRQSEPRYELPRGSERRELES